MRLLIRLFTIVAALLVLRSLLAPLIKAIARWINPPASTPQQAAGGGAPASELKKDPVCGTFVAPEVAVTAKVGGQVVYFCSQKCRDQYAAG